MLSRTPVGTIASAQNSFLSKDVGEFRWVKWKRLILRCNFLSLYAHTCQTDSAVLPVFLYLCFSCLPMFKVFHPLLEVYLLLISSKRPLCFISCIVVLCEANVSRDVRLCIILFISLLSFPAYSRKNKKFLKRHIIFFLSMSKIKTDSTLSVLVT